MKQEDKEPLIERYKKSPKKIIFRISLAAVISCCLVISFYFIIARYEGFAEVLSAIGAIFQPFVFGAIMAFLMNPIMKAMEKPLNRWLLKKSKDEVKTKSTVRTVTSMISLVILIAIIALVLLLIIPDTYDTVSELSANIGGQAQSLLAKIDNLTQHRFSAEIAVLQNSKLIELVQSAYGWILSYFDLTNKTALQSVATGAFAVGRVVINIIIGMFVSIYILIYKDNFRGQIKQIVYAIFKKEQANVILEVGRKTNDIFYGFVIGKIIDSIIVGIICYIACLIFSVPYAVLVSVIIGVTNIIPVFGPYIGGIPAAIILLLTDPVKGLIFVIIFVAIQIVDGNLIGPKILGESTGLSVFWVLVGILVGGGLFGFVGMLLGVPVMAVIYYIFGRLFKKMVRKKGLSDNTAEYIELNRVDLETNEMIQNEIEPDEKSSMGFIDKLKKKSAQKKDSKEDDEAKDSSNKDEK